MTDWAAFWAEFDAGMQAARSVPDVALQATTDEAREAGGADFLKDQSPDWHRGFDHAVLLARRHDEEADR